MWKWDARMGKVTLLFTSLPINGQSHENGIRVCMVVERLSLRDNDKQKRIMTNGSGLLQEEGVMPCGNGMLV